MDPIFQLQEDVRCKLASEDLLSHVAVIGYRKKTIEGEVDLETACLTPSPDGQTGTAVVIGLPSVEVPHPNVPGPEIECVLPILCLEEPAVNGRTAKTCEENAQLVLALLEGWLIEGLGAVWASRDAITPSDAWPGRVAYEVRVRVRIPRTKVSKVTMPSISESEGTVTLAAVEDGVTIYYTTDQSYPGPNNSAATAYTGPFTVTSGGTVRWAGYLDNYQCSDAGQATIS